jgi:Flp pilus assembly protein TadD
MGSRQEAEAAFRKAMSIEKSAAEAHFNFGVMLLESGRREEAIAEYEKALELKPSYDKPAETLAGMYLYDRKTSDAIRVLRIGATHAPENVKVLHTLARVFATCPNAQLRDGPAAVSLAEQAAAKTGHQQPTVLATLAAAYAETGAFDKAIETAKTAAQLALAGGQKELAQSIDAQLALYEAGQPYRNPEL